MNPRYEKSGETAKGDGIHAPEVRLFLPDRIAVSERATTEGAKDDKCTKQGDEQFATAEQAGEQRKEEIVHFFDGQGPENVPAARKVSSPRFQKIEVKSERREKRAAKTARLLGDYEIMNACKMQTTEYGKQQQQQGCDARETQPVKVARGDF